jgi:hypothetical protein
VCPCLAFLRPSSFSWPPGVTAIDVRSSRSQQEWVGGRVALQIPDVALDHLPKFARDQATYRTASGNVQRRKAQFIVLDYHPETFRHHRALLPTPLPFGACLRFTLDLVRVSL